MQSVNIKGSAIELLDVMLEKTDEKSEDLVRDIANNLDIEALHHTLVEFYELKNDQEVKDNGYDDEAETGLFRTYHALVHLTDYEVSREKIGESIHWTKNEISYIFYFPKHDISWYFLHFSSRG